MLLQVSVTVCLHVMQTKSIYNDYSVFLNIFEFVKKNKKQWLLLQSIIANGEKCIYGHSTIRI